MTKKFKKFPSIFQYSGVVKTARDYANWNKKPLPKVTFSGAVKLHGTNAGIGYDGKEVWAQSRENLLSYESDNAGFAAWVLRNEEEWKKIFAVLESKLEKSFDQLYIYGEFFGSSIQKGVALNEIKEKHFGIFQIVSVTTTYVICLDEVGVEFQEEYQELEYLDTVPVHYLIRSLIPNAVVIDAIVSPVLLEIDFNEPHLVQNKLLELTLAVEEKCPVGAYFGFEGTGEGLVWTAIDAPYLPKFKTKGYLHSATKVKVVKELTEAEIASKESAFEFVEYACTENRLNQGIDKLKEMGLPVDIKSMGEFLKFIGTDILRECGDVLAKSGIERKDVMPQVSTKARNWFFEYLNAQIGIV